MTYVYMARFGTHPSGPSEVLIDGKYELLKTFLEVCFFIFRFT